MSEETRLITDLEGGKSFIEEMIGGEIDPKRAKKIDKSRLRVPEFNQARKDDRDYVKWVEVQHWNAIHYLKRFKKRKRSQFKKPRKIKKALKNFHWTTAAMINRGCWLETKKAKYTERFTEEDRKELEAIYKRINRPYPITKWMLKTVPEYGEILKKALQKDLEQHPNIIRK